MTAGSTADRKIKAPEHRSHLSLKSEISFIIHYSSVDPNSLQLRDKDSGEVLGAITEDDFQFLIDNLEEESEDDTDYFLNRSTIEIFMEKGTNKTLIKLLENALGDRDDMEIEWLKA